MKRKIKRKRRKGLSKLFEGLKYKPGRAIRLNQKTLKIKKGKDYAEVVFLGDVHFGSPQCHKNKFIDMVDYCCKNSLYVFLMGDLIEMATRESVGAGIYEQEIIGQNQVEEIIEILKPLSRKKLILGLLQGNHEERVYKSTGVDVAKIMATILNVPYLGNACWNLFKVKKQKYFVYTLHGRTAARYEGTALTALERLSSSFNADLICMGHSHKLISSHTINQDVRNGKVIERKKFLLITGSYLSYDKSYAQSYGLNIAKIGSPKVKFFAKRKDIHIST